jgi:hypothetical protein
VVGGSIPPGCFHVRLVRTFSQEPDMRGLGNRACRELGNLTEKERTMQILAMLLMCIGAFSLALIITYYVGVALGVIKGIHVTLYH